MQILMHGHAGCVSKPPTVFSIILTLRMLGRPENEAYDIFHHAFLIINYLHECLSLIDQDIII